MSDLSFAEGSAKSNWQKVSQSHWLELIAKAKLFNARVEEAGVTVLIWHGTRKLSGYDVPKLVGTLRDADARADLGHDWGPMPNA